MFQVVACGFPAAPVPDLLSDASVAELPRPTAEEFVDAALDLLLPAEPDAATLLVHDGTPAGTHRLRVLRSLLGRPTLLPVGLPLPPTGLAATATVLAALSAARVDAGAVIGSLPLIGTRLPVRAATRTLTHLDRAEIGLGRTLTSFVPGVSTPLRFDGERLVVGARATEPLDTDGPVTLVQAGDHRLAGAVGQPPDDVTATVDLPAPASLTHDWWGTRRHFEQCAVPMAVAPLAAEIATARWQRCPECGDAMHDYCRFCSAQEVYA